MESYVVRIYRRQGKRSRILVGTVEVAESGRKEAFSSIEELWETLRRGRPRKEAMTATAGTRMEETAEGTRGIERAAVESIPPNSGKGTRSDVGKTPRRVSPGSAAPGPSDGGPSPARRGR